MGRRREDCRYCKGLSGAPLVSRSIQYQAGYRTGRICWTCWLALGKRLLNRVSKTARRWDRGEVRRDKDRP